MKQKNGKKIAFLVLIAEIIINLGIVVGGYAQYLMTDIVRVDMVAVSVIMTAGNIIGLLATIFGGALITNTRSRFGQFRPWLAALYVLLAVSLFAMMFSYGSPAVTIAVMGVAYAVYSVSYNLGATPKYGLYAAMGGEDSNLRNDINGKSWAGFNASSIVSGLLLLPLVYMIAGNGSERNGWLCTHALLTVLMLIGLFIILKIGKPYDPDNRSMGVETAEKVSFKSMLKAVFVNRSAWTVTLGGVCRYTGTTLMWTLMYYHVLYVLGDYMLMTIATVTTSLAAALAGMVAPVAAQKIGGRKKTATVAAFLAAAVYASLCFVGKTSWGFVVAVTAAGFIAGFADSVDPLLYIDAGEYWLAKHGEDTRPFLMSVQGIASNFGMTISSALFGVALISTGYETDVMLTGAGATAMTNWMGLAPAAALALYGVFLLIHNVSDKEMEACIVQNAEAGLGMEE